MTTDIQGKIKSVYVTPIGTYLEADQLFNSPTLPVSDVDDFDEEGGFLSVDGGASLAYTGYTVIAGVGVDAEGELNPPTYLINMTSLTPLNYTEGMRVNVSPYGEEKMAIVNITGNDDEGVIARIPHELSVLLDDGVRDEVDDAESVILNLKEDGDFVVTQVIGKQGSLLSTYLDKHILEITDETPPSSSPAAEVVGGVGSLFVKWDPISNNDLVTYRVYVSTAINFVPAVANLVAMTTGSSMNVSKLPDGTAPVAGVIYYVKIIAMDEDGDGPEGLQGSSQTKLITGPDISVAYVYAGAIQATQITGGTITSDLLMSGSIKTALSGARLELSATGLNIFGPSGILVASLGTNAISEFNGKVFATSINIIGGLTLNGTDNVFSKGSIVTLSSKQPNPTAPATITFSYTTSLADGNNAYNLSDGWKAFPPQWDGTRIVIAWYRPEGAGYRIEFNEVNQSTGAFVSTLKTVAQTRDFAISDGPSVLIGALKVGSKYIVLTQPFTTQGNYYLTDVDTASTRFVQMSNFTDSPPNFSTDGTYVYVSEINQGGGAVRRQQYSINNALGSSIGPSMKNFESGVGTWYNYYPGSGTSFVQSATYAHGGSFSMKVDCPNGGQFGIGSGKFPVTPSTYSEFEGWVRGVFDKIQVLVIFYDAGGVVTGSGVYNISGSGASGAWKRFAFQNFASASSTQAEIIITADKNSASFEYYFDDVNAYASPQIQQVGSIVSFGSGFADNDVVKAALWGGGSYDLGAARNLAVVKSAATGLSTVQVFDGGTNALIPLESWPLNTPTDVGGMIWNATASAFQSFDSSLTGRVKTHYEGGNKWTTAADGTWWVKYNWKDTNATGGTHNTLAGPAVSFSMAKRSKLNVSCGTIPSGGTDDPDAVAVWLGKGAALPANTAMYLQGVPPYSPIPNEIVVSTAVFSGTALSTIASNDFPSTTAARIVSEDLVGGVPEIDLRGDGTWRLPGAIRRLGAQQLTTIGATIGATIGQNAGSVAVTLRDGYTYRATFSGNFTPNTAGQYIEMALKWGVAASIGGTQFGQSFIDCRAVSRTVAAPVFGEFTYSGADTNVNIVAVATGQGGSVTRNATATVPCILTVDEIAP